MITAPETVLNAKVLGPSKVHWGDLIARLATDCGIKDREWNSYSPTAGWALRLKIKKRNIVYLAVCNRAFRVSFIFGDRAVAAVRESKLPKKIIRLVDRGAEGGDERQRLTSES
jgi:hypothetical protein